MTSRRRFLTSLAGLVAAVPLLKARAPVETSPSPIINQYVTRCVGCDGNVSYQIIIPIPAPPRDHRFAWFDITQHNPHSGDLLLGRDFFGRSRFLVTSAPYGCTYRIYTVMVDGMWSGFTTFNPWAAAP